MANGFAARVDVPEIMDDFGIEGNLIDQTLRELEIINLLLGGNHVTVSGIRKLLKNQQSNGKKVSIADLGTGGGDMLLRIHKLGQNISTSMEIIGFDANPYIADYSDKKFGDYTNIRVELSNVLSDEFKKHEFDIITATLFMHHFNNVALVQLLKQLKQQARKGIVINDLHRHWFAYHSIKWLTRIYSGSSMVINDAPLSVKRAFTRKELKNILKEAEIHHYSIQWKWAFRWQVIIYS